MHAISDNLKYAMAQRGLNSRELAKRSNVKPSFIYDILNGKSTNPSSVKLSQVAECLRVSLSDLVRAHDANTPTSRQPQREHYFLSPDVTTIDFFEPHDGITPKSGFCDARAPMTHFDIAWLRQHTQSTTDQLRMVDIRDDSMSPSLNPRDVVMIDCSAISPDLPGIYAFQYGGNISVKRIDIPFPAQGNTLRLISDNPLYGPIECDKRELRVLGKVIWVSKWL